MIGIGVGTGLVRDGGTFFGGPSRALPSGSSPNLLVFPEAFDNAAWVKASTVVTPDIGDATYPNADQLAMSGSGSGIVSQLSTTAATVGAPASLNSPMTTSWQIFSKTATFDGLPYTLTAVMRQPSGADSDVALQIARFGGFLRAAVFDLSGDDPTFYIRFVKLEQSASFSGYP